VIYPQYLYIMLRCFYFIPFFIFLYSCSVTQDPPVHVHPENFKAGQMLQDIRPLSSSRNTDLREMAFTLPIIESRNNLDWYYEESESAVSSPRWNLPADGAQDPVVLVRLPRLEDGSQQIQMQYL